MKYRKLLSILLTLALSLGITPAVGADGTVGGHTTLKSRTLAPAMARSSTGDYDDIDIKFDETGPIVVTVTNIYKIQVNPYGMTIERPGEPGHTSDKRIVSSPVLIKNYTNVKMEVSATATATSTVIDGEDSVEFEPDDTNLQEPFIPDEFDDSTTIPHEERVYLYLQMVGDYDPDAEWDEQEWDKQEKKVITKPGGSDPLTVTMEKGSETVPSCAALKIGGVTSIPSKYGAWSRGCGFNVNVVLSFMPKQDDYYSISFDAFDYWFTRGKAQKLYYPVEFIIEPAQGDNIEYPSEFIKDNKRQPLRFEAGYLSTAADINTPRADNNMVVKAKKNITFTVKTGEEAKGDCYLIRKIILIRGNNEPEELYDIGSDRYVQYSQTIDVSEIDPQENLTVHVVLNKVSIP